MQIQVVNTTRGTVLGGQVRLADEALSRLRGYLFRTEPGPGEGILLSPCQAVHMFGMRFALDVVFIAEDGTVIAAHEGLQPWRWTPLYRRAMHALELPVGTIESSSTQPGDALSWTPIAEATDEAGAAEAAQVRAYIDAVSGEDVLKRERTTA
jgi:uncharacterized membrane protein (UPF0127 family)